MKTPCVGKWDLFDSTDRRDHLEARALCATCPAIATCARELKAIRTNAGVYGQPEGTWAGQFLIQATENGRKRMAAEQRAERLAAEDARYSDEEARLARNATTRGDRSEWARTGNRVYERRRKQRKDVV